MKSHLRQTMRELAQLRRQLIAIETDVYKSMNTISASANRFLASRLERIQALQGNLVMLDEIIAHPKQGKHARKRSA